MPLLLNLLGNLKAPQQTHKGIRTVFYFCIIVTGGHLQVLQSEGMSREEAERRIQRVSEDMQAIIGTTHAIDLHMLTYHDYTE